MNAFDQLPASIEWMKNKDIRSRGCADADDANKEREHQRGRRGQSCAGAVDHQDRDQGMEERRSHIRGSSKQEGIWKCVSKGSRKKVLSGFFLLDLNRDCVFVR